YNIGNSYSRWDETEPKFRQINNVDKSKHVGGYVKNNQFLTMNITSEGSVRTNKTIWHEIFHTFGRKDFKENEKGSGIMNYPPMYFNQDDVNFFGNEGAHKNPSFTERGKAFPLVE